MSEDHIGSATLDKHDFDYFTLKSDDLEGHTSCLVYSRI